MDEAVRDLVWFVLIFLAIGAIWYFSGGPERNNDDQPFLETSQEDAVQRVTESILPGGMDDSDDEDQSLPDAESAYKYEATLNAGSAIRKANPQEEYIEIRASSRNEKAIPLSEWSVEGKDGLSIKLGGGTRLLLAGQVNREESIFLQPGEKAIVVTGSSPVGVSFQLNKCTGYFEQFQDFYPNLPKRCPHPYDEILPGNLKDYCLDYIEDMDRCEIQIDALPIGFNSACQSYVTRDINYKACVDLHKNDSNFYESEWRVYLGRQQEMWRNNRETVILKDENDKIVDWDSY